MSRSRSQARRRALQALYQWQMTGQDLCDIDRQFLEEQEMGKVDIDYFQELLHQVPKFLEEIDGQCDAFLDRPMSQIDPVEQAILRIGSYELAKRPEIPYRVIINEAVELAKVFGAEQSHKYINGVLDKVAHELRAVEMKKK
jgi:N utilization substance protein B